MENKDCSICFEDMNDKPKGYLPCKHNFCLSCLIKYLKEISILSCPFCRKKYDDIFINKPEDSLPEEHIPEAFLVPYIRADFYDFNENILSFDIKVLSLRSHFYKAYVKVAEDIDYKSVDIKLIEDMIETLIFFSNNHDSESTEEFFNRLKNQENDVYKLIVESTNLETYTLTLVLELKQ